MRNFRNIQFVLLVGAGLGSLVGYFGNCLADFIVDVGGKGENLPYFRIIMEKIIRLFKGLGEERFHYFFCLFFVFVLIIFFFFSKI